MNISEDVLVNDYIRLFPNEHTVVEILESVTPTPRVVKACRGLKHSGYTLALDDYKYDARSEDLLRLADIIKVDVLATPPEEVAELVHRMELRDVRLLAEKVESEEMFQRTLTLGYHYFQGYFFARPVMVSASDVPGYKMHYMEILKEIHRVDLDFNQLELIIKREASLCYKLLRYINSVAFGWRGRIESIKRALVLLGEREVKKWASFVALASMADDKPEELMVISVLRARFCEMLAPCAGMDDQAQDLFLLGIFSTLEVVLGRPFKEILKDLPVLPELKEALEGQEGKFRDVLDYAIAYEKGDWPRLEELAGRLNLDQTEIPQRYLEAVAWASKTISRQDEPA